MLSFEFTIDSELHHGPHGARATVSQTKSGWVVMVDGRDPIPVGTPSMDECQVRRFLGLQD